MKSFNLGKSKEEQRFRSLFTRNVFTDYLEIDPNNNEENLNINKEKSLSNGADNKTMGINANNGNINNVNAIYLSGVLTKRPSSTININDANINTINFTGNTENDKADPFDTIYAQNETFYFVSKRPNGLKPSTNVIDTNTIPDNKNVCIAKLNKDYLTLRSGIRTYGDVFIGTDDHRKTTTINGTLNVSGDTTIGGTLSVSGATILSNTLNISGNTTIGGTLSVSGATTLSNTLSVSGNTTIGGTLSVSGAITNTDLTNRLNAKADKASHTNNTNTFTKITYNSQGIIIAGDGLAASDIPSLEISKINGLQTALDNKAALTHTHAIADITNLQTTLNNKSNTNHTHTGSNSKFYYNYIENTATANNAKKTCEVGEAIVSYINNPTMSSTLLGDITFGGSGTYIFMLNDNTIRYGSSISFTNTTNTPDNSNGIFYYQQKRVVFCFRVS